jgi:hypothetical protein
MPKTSYRSLVREYDDNTYRRYSKSTAKHGELSIPFDSYSLTKRNAVQAFFEANWNLEFYIYVWPEASAVDSGGSSTTGRHLARFDADPELEWENRSSCAYGGALKIILLS